MVLCCQAVLSQANLRATLSKEISCTDASPTGGGSGTATTFLEASPGVPEKEEASSRCGHCAKDLTSLDFDGYECPNECGRVGCSIECIAAHRHVCSRYMLGKACFGERFSGPNGPLTMAVALEKVFVQPPLDCLRESGWNFFSSSGRECLEGLEDDGHLAASHCGRRSVRRSWRREAGLSTPRPEGSYKVHRL